MALFIKRLTVNLAFGWSAIFECFITESIRCMHFQPKKRWNYASTGSYATFLKLPYDIQNQSIIKSLQLIYINFYDNSIKYVLHMDFFQRDFMIIRK